MPPDAFYYLTRFPSVRARDAALRAFGADPEWKAAKAASETDGPAAGWPNHGIACPDGIFAQ